MNDKLKLVPNFIYNNAMPISLTGSGGLLIYDSVTNSYRKRKANEGAKVSVPIKYLNNESKGLIETPYNHDAKKRKQKITDFVNIAPVVLPIATAAVIGARNSIRALNKPGVKNTLRSLNPILRPGYLYNELSKADPHNTLGKATSVALTSSALGKFIYNRLNRDKIRSDKYYAIRYNNDEIIILREFSDRDLAYDYKYKNPGVKINKGSTLITKGFNKNNKEG